MWLITARWIPSTTRKDPIAGGEPIVMCWGRVVAAPAGTGALSTILFGQQEHVVLVFANDIVAIGTELDLV